ncbi:hypothetical protein Cni_G05635 [Canna indica]|uniref:Reverse transcriptase domain-containing protein n=1 Tax=Canna indica TaxID=4628 RepID=A0AAQ3JVH8_9LILI|nr:hypothetical protein Cni_G05635 [Canna indica]
MVTTFTGVYGPSQRNVSRSFIHGLYQIIEGVTQPHILGGDFNLTKGDFERLNCHGAPRDSRDFSKFIADSGLIDVPISGVTNTWTNHQNPPAFAKLDRILICPNVASSLPLFWVSGVSRRLSDHTPLIFNSKRQFSQKDFAHIIKEGLKSSVLISPRLGGTLSGWIKAWKSSRRIIKDWDRLKKKSRNFDRKQLEDKILALSSTLESSNFTSADTEALKLAKEGLDKLYHTEDLYWRQRAKKRWFKEGDRNTRYFHQCASNRKRANWINHLQTDLGPTSDREKMADMFKTHFVSILGVAVPPLLQVNWSYIFAPQHDLLQDMAAPFSTLEVENVIKFMKNYKSPGSDDGISHVLYGDDLIMFSKASSQCFTQIRLLFKCFELVSGLTINTNKTKVIHLGGNEQTADSLANILRLSSSLVVGNGRQVKFWIDTWVDNSPLRVQFPTLLVLSSAPDAKIADLKDYDTLSNPIGWNIQFTNYIPITEESHAHIFGTCNYSLVGWWEVLRLSGLQPFQMDYSPWNDAYHNGKTLSMIKFCALMIWR